MKIAFIVHTEVYSQRVMALLNESKIDYYTKWDEVKGKGHGTEAHLGTRSFPEINSVLMIAFESDEPLEALTKSIVAMNAQIPRPDDHIRIFQLPLERIV